MLLIAIGNGVKSAIQVKQKAVNGLLLPLLHDYHQASSVTRLLGSASVMALPYVLGFCMKVTKTRNALSSLTGLITDDA